MSYPPIDDIHEQDRHWLVWIRTITRDRLLLALAFEVERWRRIAINRELDRREKLAW